MHSAKFAAGTPHFSSSFKYCGSNSFGKSIIIQFLKHFNLHPIKVSVYFRANLCQRLKNAGLHHGATCWKRWNHIATSSQDKKEQSGSLSSMANRCFVSAIYALYKWSGTGSKKYNEQRRDQPSGGAVFTAHPHYRWVKKWERRKRRSSSHCWLLPWPKL